MMLLKNFLIYILIGVPINWIVVFLTWGMLGIITRNHFDLYSELYEKYDRMKVGLRLFGRIPYVRVGFNMLVWPFSVLNHIVFGGGAVIEAIVRLKSRDSNSSLDEANEKEENQ